MTSEILSQKSASLSSCAKCRGELVRDPNSGEIACQKCGLVILDYSEEVSYSRYSKSSDNSLDYQLTSSTVSLPDYGLSTEISQSNKDSRGKYLSQRDGLDAGRLAKWHRRIKTSNPQQRVLTTSLGKISEVTQILALPKSVSEEASWICRKSLKLGSLAGKPSKGIAVASVFLACRRLRVDRSLKQIAEAGGISHRIVWKYYGLISNDLGGANIPRRNIKTYISKLANISKIDPRIERLALEIANETEAEMIPGGKTPLGVAAAHLYIGSVLLGGFIPEKEIAEVAEISDVTLRMRCREILEQFTIRQKLNPRN